MWKYVRVDRRFLSLHVLLFLTGKGGDGYEKIFVWHASHYSQYLVCDRFLGAESR